MLNLLQYISKNVQKKVFVIIYVTMVEIVRLHEVIEGLAVNCIVFHPRSTPACIR